MVTILLSVLTFVGGMYGTGKAGLSVLQLAHDRLKSEVLTKLREPRPSLVDYNRKLTGLPPLEERWGFDKAAQ